MVCVDRGLSEEESTNNIISYLSSKHGIFVVKKFNNDLGMVRFDEARIKFVRTLKDGEKWQEKV